MKMCKEELTGSLVFYMCILMGVDCKALSDDDFIIMCECLGNLSTHDLLEIYDTINPIIKANYDV